MMGTHSRVRLSHLLLNGCLIQSVAADTDQRVAQFASKFRGRMNESMRFGQHGQYRVQFFNAVIAKAMEVSVP